MLYIAIIGRFYLTFMSLTTLEQHLPAETLRH